MHANEKYGSRSEGLFSFPLNYVSVLKHLPEELFCVL